MIRITLDESSLAKVRIATSPLWETLSSIALLNRYRTEMPYPYEAWAGRARQVVSQPFYEELSGWIRQLRPLRWPSFLASIPAAGSTSIHDELAALRRTTPQDVVSELAELYPDGVPGPLVSFADSPADALARFTDLVESYYLAALAPYWTAMRGVLEEEILFRGRTLATEGTEAMLRDLGGQVRWEGRRLSLPHQTDIECVLRRSQLLIVPVLFGRGMRMFSRDFQGTTAISYQARGAAVLATRPTPGAGSGTSPCGLDRLALLLGRSRAAVLRALAVPTTTTSVSETLGLAPSTVSEHLTTLSAAGMIRRRRVGFRVLYELDRGGLALISHLDGQQP
ncbi:winged helix-turn-helix domain-containing protein [Micromonospora sp. NBRC 101691]|uniref:ArsR/SmtB family transcription factor n=1 Tax=Micromonospora sp. NBRC 101691 TaxID=3032198 RepID=UPI0024A0E9E6|nr:winged helix-turn-helix domain-containing protein [Micromonospora sp. NBRC 101691]GLY26195.1 transcriptional regulator [Micromonospora sp. NBRC 101691]